MKQQEFIELIEQYGFDLKKLSVVIGELIGLEDVCGVCEKNGQWIFYSVYERNQIHEIPVNSEDEAFENLLGEVLLRLRSFTDRFVTREIAKLPKSTVCKFLKKEYSLNEKQAEDAWEYLKQDMRALFEFKYYIANGEFPPNRVSCKAQGYSAEQIYNSTDLDVLGAFNHLIYLKIQLTQPGA